MVAVAQSVRALDCGSRGCGFDSRQPPLTDCEIADFGLRIGWPFESAIRNRQSAIDCRSVAQLVEHRSPKPGVAGSIPAGPAWAGTVVVAAYTSLRSLPTDLRLRPAGARPQSSAPAPHWRCFQPCARLLPQLPQEPPW